jgi:hypothetical protein
MLSDGLLTYEKPSLRELAVNTMINGDLKAMISPCGVNCSYNLQFDGPYLSCISTNTSRSMDLHEAPANYTLPPIFEANWTISPNESSSRNALATGHLDFVVLHADFLGQMPKNSTNVLNYTENTISCYPRRAEYKLHQTFENGQSTSNVTIGSVYELVPLPGYVTPPPGVNKETWLYNSNGSWGNEADNYLRDSNIMALIQTFASPLLGSFSTGQFGYGGPGEEPISDGTDDGIKWFTATWTVPADLGGTCLDPFYTLVTRLSSFQKPRTTQSQRQRASSTSMATTPSCKPKSCRNTPSSQLQSLF